VEIYEKLKTAKTHIRVIEADSQNLIKQIRNLNYRLCFTSDIKILELHSYILMPREFMQEIKPLFPGVKNIEVNIVHLPSIAA
jgi:hypothetical protein